MAACDRSISNLTDDLFIYKLCKDPANPSFRYEVECASLQNVEFTLSLEGSRNVAFDTDYLKPSITVHIPPFTRIHLGTIIILEPLKDAKLVVVFSWKYFPVDRGSTRNFAALQNQCIMQSMSEFSMYYFSTDRVDIERAQEIFDQTNYSFIDFDFPPRVSSISGTITHSPLNEILATTHHFVTWRRPNEFMAGESYDVFKDSIEPDDIRQGSLTDCWILSALSSLAEYPELVEVHRIVCVIASTLPRIQYYRSNHLPYCSHCNSLNHFIPPPTLHRLLFYFKRNYLLLAALK